MLFLHCSDPALIRGGRLLEEPAAIGGNTVSILHDKVRGIVFVKDKTDTFVFNDNGLEARVCQNTETSAACV